MNYILVYDVLCFSSAIDKPQYKKRMNISGVRGEKTKTADNMKEKGRLSRINNISIFE